MQQHPLPEGLGDRFTVAAALRAGVSAGRLTNDDLERPFHGLRRRIGQPDDPIVCFDRAGKPRGSRERAHLALAFDYAQAMGSHEFFSHITAAVIWELPLPASLLNAAPIHIAVVSPLRLPRSRGIRGHQAVSTQTLVRQEEWTGLKVADPATTWAMLASVIVHPHDLVAVADAVVREWRTEPLGSIADLESAIGRGRRVGINRLRDALPDVRTRSASRPETRTRLVLVEAGLEEPELNHDVYVDGIRLACVDLAYPRLRIAIEYEGEHHLKDPAQWARDIARYDRLAAAGWRVIRVTKSELFDRPGMLVHRVRVAIAERV